MRAERPARFAVRTVPGGFVELHAALANRGSAFAPPDADLMFAKASLLAVLQPPGRFA